MSAGVTQLRRAQARAFQMAHWRRPTGLRHWVIDRQMRAVQIRQRPSVIDAQYQNALILTRRDIRQTMIGRGDDADLIMQVMAKRHPAGLAQQQIGRLPDRPQIIRPRQPLRPITQLGPNGRPQPIICRLQRGRIIHRQACNH